MNLFYLFHVCMRPLFLAYKNQKGSFALQFNRMIHVDEKIALKLINCKFNQPIFTCSKPTMKTQ